MNKNNKHFTITSRDIPTFSEIISLVHVVSQDFKNEDEELTEEEILNGNYEKSDLEKLLDKLLAQIWIFYYDRGLELAKEYDRDHSELVDTWHLLSVLADIYFRDASDRYFVFLLKKPFKSYTWYPKLVNIIKKLASIGSSYRFKMLRQARKNAGFLYKHMIKFIETPNEELKTKILSNIRKVRWYGNLLSVFGTNFYDKETLVEKLDLLQEIAENLGDIELSAKIDIFAELYRDELELFRHGSEFPEFISEGVVVGDMEKLPPKEREYIEDFIERVKTIRDIELDLQYIKEHSEDFSLFFSAFIIGVENIVTISALFRPMQLNFEEILEPYGLFESYYSISWSEFPRYFNLKSNHWQKLVIDLPDRELRKGINNITAACMAYITDRVREYNIRDVYCFVPKDIDVDFERLNIKERSGLDKTFREKLAKMIRESLEEKTSVIGIPVVKVPISLEEQMQDFSADNNFF